MGVKQVVYLTAEDIELCREIVGWRKTGILTGEKLVAMAEALPEGLDEVRYAEEQVIKRIVKTVAATEITGPDQPFHELELPKVWERYRHTDGSEYTVELVANVGSQQADFPATVVYRDDDGRAWSEPLGRFLADMTRVAEDEGEAQ